VCEARARPSMHRCPSHQADDIGARFEVPSSFSLLINTTGVPKYRMFGSVTVCMAIERAGRGIREIGVGEPIDSAYECPHESVFDF
jgi:hypothetical protein